MIRVTVGSRAKGISVVAIVAVLLVYGSAVLMCLLIDRRLPRSSDFVHPWGWWEGAALAAAVALGIFSLGTKIYGHRTRKRKKHAAK